ncbi:MAG: hypothetical protein JGK08_07850 [Microcoleus sp. PH2017_04_SCI_O_A]|nr:hypothetical protein [Microcoleus sp. PH2017_04_SCI_O_A]
MTPNSPDRHLSFIAQAQHTQICREFNQQEAGYPRCDWNRLPLPGSKRFKDF